jgi:hypothetical protein
METQSYEAQAAAHARQAEELLAEARAKRDVKVSVSWGAQAGAHATLALYYQREAER